MKRLGRRLRAQTGSKNPRRDTRLEVLRMMPKGSVCAEIGVWKGNLSRRILNRVHPSSLHLIDPWEFFADEGYEKAMYGGKVAKSQMDMDSLYEAVKEKFADEISAGVVHLHRERSAEAAARFRDDYFDWVYIDGNHRYDFVLQDLLGYHPKVKPDGFIAGDDYGTQGWWGDGVKEAVDEFVASGKAEWALRAGSQFVLRKIE